ncbi:MAG: MaoC family dehydratase [Casimicrobiaceae bacterium]
MSLAATLVSERYFEDYVVGSVVDCGTVHVDPAEILEFGRRFDPQPFHADPVAAASGPFGGLIASGWHTASLMMRLFVRSYISSVASLASPGAESLQWLKPVRGGDVLHVVIEVVQARPSRSKPDRGIIVSSIVVSNQDDEPVMTMKVTNVLGRRRALRECCNTEQ